MEDYVEQWCGKLEFIAKYSHAEQFLQQSRLAYAALQSDVSTMPYCADLGSGRKTAQ